MLKIEKKINLVTSVVIYDPDMSDLKLLFSSYQKSVQYAQRMYDISDKLIIVDNNPNGTYADEVEKLLDKNIHYEYIKSTINGGYGHGHNHAIFSCDSDYHLICNPDIEFFEDTISIALKTMNSRDEVVLLTPSVQGKDGERQYLCKRNPQLLHLFLRRFAPKFFKEVVFKRYLDKYEYRDHSYDEPIVGVPFCTGCFMFFRADTLKKLNGFDANFFMYMEDADLSRRALAYGQTLYLPTFKVVHRWERGSYKSSKLRNAAIKSGLYYSKKWFLRRV